MNPVLRICNSCTHFDGENSCKAFPEGIPLKSKDTHFEVLPGQVGDTIYDMDPDMYDMFEMYRRVHPSVKFPVIVSYELPDEDEVMTQRDSNA